MRPLKSTGKIRNMSECITIPTNQIMSITPNISCTYEVITVPQPQQNTIEVTLERDGWRVRGVFPRDITPEKLSAFLQSFLSLLSDNSGKCPCQ